MMLPLFIIRYKYRQKFSCHGGMGERMRMGAAGAEGMKAYLHWKYFFPSITECIPEEIRENF